MTAEIKIKTYISNKVRVSSERMPRNSFRVVEWLGLRSGEEDEHKLYLMEHEDIDSDEDYEMVLSRKDRKRLWGLAAAKCAICKCDLFADNESHTNIGKECHISSHKPNHPSESFSRYDPSFTEVERDRKYDNAILLCGHHHDEIDDPEGNEWTIEKLRQIKAEHEAWVASKLAEDTEESRELKRRIEDVTRRIEIYETEFTLNKERHAWQKNELMKLENTANGSDDVDVSAELRRIHMSGTTRNLENSLDRYGMGSQGPISCPHCHANLVYDPNTATMYCQRCKKYREGDVV